MRLIESGYMINYAHTPHLASYSFKHPGREIIFVAEWRENRQEFVWCVFKFYKDSQKYLLMILVAGKQELCQLIQALDPGYFVIVQLYFGAWHFFTPAFLGKKWPSRGYW